MSDIPFVGWIALIIFGLGAVMHIRTALITAKLTGIRNKKTMDTYYKDLAEANVDPAVEEQQELAEKAEAEKIRADKKAEERQARIDDERLLMKEWADTMRQLHAEGINVAPPARSFNGKRSNSSSKRIDPTVNGGTPSTTAP